PRQERINGILCAHSLHAWAKWARRCAWGTGEWSLFLRQWRSRRFIKTRLKLTPYHFHDCRDAPKDLGLDMLAVGSDQVWHPNAQPGVYLLDELKQVPGIAYAASFGANMIPKEMEELYRKGFQNFKAIGIREKEGVEIARRLGALSATHVVDPTILVNPERWHEFIGGAPRRTHRKHIACYFLAEDFLDLAERLGMWAKKNGLTVDLFAQNFSVPFRRFRPCGDRWLKYWKCRLCLPLHFRYAAGPVEFVRKIAAADCVFTNSFHALMFSMVFRRNVRIIKPTAQIRKGMAARMREFAGTVITGPLIMETLEEAFASYERGERVSYDEAELKRRRAESEAWLKKAIKTAKGTDNGK
ncbi:MAG: polysaccharide pyruvyl transferase family protein, partial [Kiritimatiellae bacterium]|nr:polysaccharide pyruvyl transferase family protein [Kiritimatiellia bacterium]